MPMPRNRTPGRANLRTAAPAGDPAVQATAPIVAATTAATTATARDAVERTQLDLVQLNLAYLHVARELSRAARDMAITRLGLDAAACAALDRLSVDDLQALAHCQGLLFTLRIDAADLVETARLARADRTAFEARLLLSRPRP